MENTDAFFVEALAKVSIDVRPSAVVITSPYDLNEQLSSLASKFDTDFWSLFTSSFSDFISLPSNLTKLLNPTVVSALENMEHESLFRILLGHPAIQPHLFPPVWVALVDAGAEQQPADLQPLGGRCSKLQALLLQLRFLPFCRTDQIAEVVDVVATVGDDAAVDIVGCLPDIFYSADCAAGLITALTNLLDSHASPNTSPLLLAAAAAIATVLGSIPTSSAAITNAINTAMALALRRLPTTHVVDAAPLAMLFLAVADAAVGPISSAGKRKAVVAAAQTYWQRLRAAFPRVTIPLASPAAADIPGPLPPFCQNLHLLDAATARIIRPMVELCTAEQSQGYSSGSSGSSCLVPLLVTLCKEAPNRANALSSHAAALQAMLRPAAAAAALPAAASDTDDIQEVGPPGNDHADGQVAASLHVAVLAPIDLWLLLAAATVASPANLSSQAKLFLQLFKAGHITPALLAAAIVPAGGSLFVSGAYNGALDIFVAICEVPSPSKDSYAAAWLAAMLLSAAVVASYSSTDTANTKNRHFNVSTVCLDLLKRAHASPSNLLPSIAIGILLACAHGGTAVMHALRSCSSLLSASSMCPFALSSSTNVAELLFLVCATLCIPLPQAGATGIADVAFAFDDFILVARKLLASSNPSTYRAGCTAITSLIAASLTPGCVSSVLLSVFSGHGRAQNLALLPQALAIDNTLSDQCRLQLVSLIKLAATASRQHLNLPFSPLDQVRRCLISTAVVASQIPDEKVVLDRSVAFELAVQISSPLQQVASIDTTCWKLWQLPPLSGSRIESLWRSPGPFTVVQPYTDPLLLLCNATAMRSCVTLALGLGVSIVSSEQQEDGSSSQCATSSTFEVKIGEGSGSPSFAAMFIECAPVVSPAMFKLLAPFFADVSGTLSTQPSVPQLGWTPYDETLGTFITSAAALTTAAMKQLIAAVAWLGEFSLAAVICTVTEAACQTGNDTNFSDLPQEVVPQVSRAIMRWLWACQLLSLLCGSLKPKKAPVAALSSTSRPRKERPLTYSNGGGPPRAEVVVHDPHGDSVHSEGEDSNSTISCALSEVEDMANASHEVVIGSDDEGVANSDVGSCHSAPEEAEPSFETDAAFASSAHFSISSAYATWVPAIRATHNVTALANVFDVPLAVVNPLSTALPLSVGLRLVCSTKWKKLTPNLGWAAYLVCLRAVLSVVDDKTADVPSSTYFSCIPSLICAVDSALATADQYIDEGLSFPPMFPMKNSLLAFTGHNVPPQGVSFDIKTEHVPHMYVAPVVENVLEFLSKSLKRSMNDAPSSADQWIEMIMSVRRIRLWLTSVVDAAESDVPPPTQGLTSNDPAAGLIKSLDESLRKLCPEMTAKCALDGSMPSGAAFTFRFLLQYLHYMPSVKAAGWILHLLRAIAEFVDAEYSSSKLAFVLHVHSSLASFAALRAGWWVSRSGIAAKHDPISNIQYLTESVISGAIYAQQRGPTVVDCMETLGESLHELLQFVGSFADHDAEGEERENPFLAVQGRADQMQVIEGFLMALKIGFTSVFGMAETRKTINGLSNSELENIAEHLLFLSSMFGDLLAPIRNASTPPHPGLLRRVLAGSTQVMFPILKIGRVHLPKLVCVFPVASSSIIANFQKATRALQIVCHHAKVHADDEGPSSTTGLLRFIPLLRRRLEEFVVVVKAAAVASSNVRSDVGVSFVTGGLKARTIGSGAQRRKRS